MIEQAEILVDYTSTIDEDGGGWNDPSLFANYEVVSAKDTTNQLDEMIPAAPNSFIMQFTATTEVMDAIEADTRYTILPGTRSII